VLFFGLLARLRPATVRRSYLIIMPSRPSLAVSLYVAGRRCVVVGSGPAADERVQRLRAAGADVVALATAGPADLTSAFMVFVCDAVQAERVSRDAREAGALVYVMDDPTRSDLAMPALARRGPVQIAISTEGTAPALARRLREELERLLATGGDALDTFIASLVRARDDEQVNKDHLRELASALTIEGRIRVEL
jgi:precorrin-2 dehydrogenase/sirohydrochlorin ferrochelatase